MFMIIMTYGGVGCIELLITSDSMELGGSKYLVLLVRNICVGSSKKDLLLFIIFCLHNSVLTIWLAFL